MSQKPFQFKQFRVEQDRCAMKVGTDGVLLGAWANLALSRCICDIGTGTGLISLMAAQRNKKARIIGIEMDEVASNQASYNFSHSPWAKRLSIRNADFRRVSLTEKPDHFISNPPFFNDSQLPIDPAKQKARHNVSLSLADILLQCMELGSKQHTLSLIIPSDQYDHSVALFAQNNYRIARLTRVRPTPSKPVKRVLLEGTRESDTTEFRENELVIETGRHVYTPEYIDLTRDFYLGM